MGNMKANRKFVEGEEAVSAVIGVILMVAITVAIAATVYVYVSGMLTGPGESAPNLAWTLNDADNTITMTSGSSTDNYAASASDGNLAFKNSSGTAYVLAADMSISGVTPPVGLEIGAIGAGDTIIGFSAGTYQMIWEPTDKLLGTLEFS